MPGSENVLGQLIRQAMQGCWGGVDGKRNVNTSMVVRLADFLLKRAITLRASDLHLEPQADGMKVRYRVDGLLKQEDQILPAQLAGFLVSRLKVMAGMDIAQHQKPQDGHIGFSLTDRVIDIRTSSMPTVHGEMMVCRFMNIEEKLLCISELGFSPENQQRFVDLISRPAGMVIVCGPVNNGKTTTLYAAMQALNTPEYNLVTLEDPVEHTLSGINQVQINPKGGLDYVAGLKSLLRQDTDRILLGEIRSGDTAEMAVRIALTGHLLLTTLHTEDAVAAVFRLREMGVPAYLIAATLTGVVAQRLVRRCCPDCQEIYEVKAGSPEAAMLGSVWQPGLKLKRNRGCNHCCGSGYRGRLALQEVLAVTPTIRAAILQELDRQHLQQLAEREGLKTIWEDGIAKVLSGESTLAELKRVV